MKKLVLLLLFSTSAMAQNQPLRTNFISVFPTVTSGAYAAKDVVGGLLTFNNLVCSNNRVGRMTAIMLADKNDQSVEYDIATFRSLPSGTFTNHAGFDPTDTDLSLMNPVINLSTQDHFSFVDNGISTLSSLDSRTMNAQASANTGTLYVAIIARGTPTYASASDITLTLGFTCD